MHELEPDPPYEPEDPPQADGFRMQFELPEPDEPLPYDGEELLQLAAFKIQDELDPEPVPAFENAPEEDP